jgi:catechol 2,3-dioxygenase-like lactoylglutathione lyase family enzyme
MNIEIHGGAPILVVADIKRAVEHYRDVLGFKVEFQYGEPPFYAGVERGNVVIHLTAKKETTRLPGHGAVYLFVSDVDALYAELKANGAKT